RSDFGGAAMVVYAEGAGPGARTRSCACGITRPARAERRRMSDDRYRPSRGDPLMIMAMDHRESFGRTLFGVRDDNPDARQRAAMTAAKQVIYAGLECARQELPRGHAGVLVDERYGQPVIEAARADHVILAVPVERSGRDWFEPEWGQQWLSHVSSVRPDF